MGKAILAIILGAVIGFAWQNVSWMVLHLHDDTINTFSDPAAVAAVLKENTDKHGVYVLPYAEMESEAEMEAMMEAKKKGPVVVGMVRPGSVENWSMMKCMIGGGVIQLIGALLVAILLAAAAPRLNYLGRVMFVMLIGLFAGVVSHASNWNWWEYPVDYTLVMILDLVIGWLLAGLVMAALITRQQSPAPSPAPAPAPASK